MAASGSSRPVILLGDRRLRAVSSRVTNARHEKFVQHRVALAATLERFRQQNGFGRAISMPQIGVNLRVIACNFGTKRPAASLPSHGRISMINPVIVDLSQRMFTMWDDCMSLPWLMVKVKRHASISVEFEDEHGTPHTWKDLDMSTSELIQHEMDHLDGVLMTDRAVAAAVPNPDPTPPPEASAPSLTDSLIARDMYLKHKAEFDRQVDFHIVPT